MRKHEISEGIEVLDEDGKVVGTSQTAAKNVCGEYGSCGRGYCVMYHHMICYYGDPLPYFSPMCTQAHLDSRFHFLVSCNDYFFIL